MSNGTQTPEEILDGLAAGVRFFVDQEIPSLSAWNQNPTVQQQSLQDIGGFFTDVWTTLNALTAPTGEWVPWGLPPTYVSPTTFTVSGDQRGIVPPGTRLRLHLGVPTTIVAVAAVAYASAGDTTTVTIDQPVLTTALQSVDYGFVRTSVPKIGQADFQSAAVTTAAINPGAVTNDKITGPIDYAKLSGTPPVLWTLTGSDLTPSDLTTYPAIGRSSSMRVRLQESGTFAQAFGLYTNMRWSGGTIVKDASALAAWLIEANVPLDKLVISRAPAGATALADLLTVNPDNLALALRWLTVGAGTIKGRFGDANTGNTGDFQLRTNASFATPNILDDTSKAAWTMRMDPVNDAFIVYRAPATTGTAAWAALLTCGNTGNLTSPGVIQGTSGVRGGPAGGGTGSAYLNPGANPNPGYLAFYDSNNTRHGYVGWYDGANRLYMVANENGYVGWNIQGSVVGNTFADFVGRGCFMHGPGNQSLGAGAGYATVLINNAVYTDSSGMAYPQYNQIIAPAGRWWILFTVQIEQAGSGCSFVIQQWNGSAWVTRQSFSSPAAGQFASFNSFSMICDSAYGSQFQIAGSNNNSSGSLQLITVNVLAVILGKSG